MTTLNQVEKAKQHLACYEKSLASEKLKKRRADTRRKIELGGLIIKAGMGNYDKAVILGAILHTKILITNNKNCYDFIEKIGIDAFSNLI